MDRGKKPIVSIIIPAYNAERWIRRSIDSALRQDYAYKEIIVVDDASSDNTADVVKSYGDQVRYIRQETNMGPGAARNTGAFAAQGEYLMFLDADDEYLRGIVKKMVEGFDVFPDADAGMFGYTRVDDSEHPHPVRFKEAQITWIKDFFDVKLNYSIPCTDSFICRKDVFCEAGGYVTSINRGEDKKLFVCLGGKYNWFLVPEYGAIYHSSQTATTTQNTPIDPYVRIESLILSKEEIAKWIRPELMKSFNIYHQFLVRSTINLSQSYIDNYLKFYRALRKRTKISISNQIRIFSFWMRSIFK